jgi:hypothetical protein
MARTFLSRQQLAIKLLRSPDIMRNSEGWRQICEILEERKVFIPELIQEIISRTKTKNIDRPLSICILGKLYNKKLIPLFRKVLEDSFKQKDNNSVYQTIIALDNLGQLDGFVGDNEGLCLHEQAKNMRLAKKYLEHIRRKP